MHYLKPTAADVERLTAILPMHVKMLRDYKSYKKGEIYHVPSNIGDAILDGLYGYRVD